jgi:hypothetical protein
MSKTKLTFYDYIHSISTSYDVNTLKMVFGERVFKIPNRILSSKYLMENLGVNSDFEFRIFKNAYMEYFRVFLNKETI